MGHGHAHGSGGKDFSAGAVAGRRRANILLLAVLVPLAVLTVAAMVLMWPTGNRGDLKISSPYAAAPGVSFDTGTVLSAGMEDCPSSAPVVAAGGTGTKCLVAHTQPDQGGNLVAVEITPEIAKSHGVKASDKLRYLNLSRVAPASGGSQYVFVDFVRTVPLPLLALVYAVVVCRRPLARPARDSLGWPAAWFIVGFMLPALLEGKSPLLVGLVGSTAIMFGVLYFAHGFSARTSTALLGTLFGLGITAAIASWATDAAAPDRSHRRRAPTLNTVAPSLAFPASCSAG